MKKREKMRHAFLAFSFSSIALLPIQVLAEPQFEAPPVFRAADLIPSAQLSGPHYRIHDTVQNDGFINRYTITVEGKTYTVDSNALMKERIQELSALQKMNQIKSSEEYTSAVKGAVGGTVKTATGLVTAPIDTVKGVGTGVKSFFGSVGHSLFGGGSEQEAGTLKVAFGFDVAKRSYASRFGIDPYTSFPPVRDRLSELSWATAGGSLTVTGAFQAIGGAAGTGMGLTKTAGGMQKIVYDRTPAELKKHNAKRLRWMSVKKDIADSFLEHPKFSPTRKTIIVDALASIGAEGREDFIRRAILVQDLSKAYFMQRWAELMAAYHLKVSLIARFSHIGKMAIAQTSKGVIIAALPIDHLAWTQKVAQRHGKNMKSIISLSKVTGAEVWIEGTVSPLARKKLDAQGWVVKERVGKILGTN